MRYSEELRTTGNAQVWHKAYRQYLYRTYGICSYCPPNGGMDNGYKYGTRGRNDRYKNHRR